MTRPLTPDVDLYDQERAGELVTHVRRLHRHLDDLIAEQRRRADRAYILQRGSACLALAA